MKLDPGAHLMAADRDKCVSQFLADFDAKHPAMIRSRLIKLDPMAAIFNEFRKSSPTPKSSIVAVDPLAALSLQPKAVEVPRSLQEWWKGTHAAESNEPETDKFPFANKRALLASLNLYFAMLPLKEYSDSANLNIYINPIKAKVVKSAKESKDAKANDKFELIREGLLPGKVVQMSFWGRVVEGSVASSCQRHLVLPVKCQPDKFPATAYGELELFLLGDQVVNTKRSDACMAYLVRPIPWDKTAEGYNDDSAEIVPADAPDNVTNRVKRQKLQLKLDEKRSKLPSATHEVKYIDFEIDAPCANSGSVVTYFLRRHHLS